VFRVQVGLLPMGGGDRCYRQFMNGSTSVGVFGVGSRWVGGWVGGWGGDRWYWQCVEGAGHRTHMCCAC